MPTEGNLGLECLSPETNVWDFDLSARTDDEPLMQEIVVAHNVQRQLFPRHKPPLQTLDYSGKCVQARTLGGGYCDFLDLGFGRVGFVLADVAGKGVAAPLLMANLQGSLHNRAECRASELPAILTAVNGHLYEHTEANRHAAVFFGCYDDHTRRLAYVNCGHSPALLLRECGEVERLEATATVLGLFGNWDCSVRETHLQTGDVLSIFTDGVTEATSSNGDEFGESGVLSVLHETRELETDKILHKIEQAVEEFRSAEYPQDDLMMVVARARCREGKSKPPSDSPETLIAAGPPPARSIPCVPALAGLSSARKFRWCGNARRRRNRQVCTTRCTGCATRLRSPRRSV
jgi:serine phosphatase RsbU (regulator of sigma subunit)